MRSQGGQVMAFIAVALAIVLMPVAAYAIDATTVGSAEASLQQATATAAMEAAQQIDPADFRAVGALALDGAAAQRAAKAVLALEVPSAFVTSVTVHGADVTITSGELVHLPFDFLPERIVRLDARASARLAGGYDSRSSRLPLPTSTF